MTRVANFTLKNYFKTGNIPTESNFADLVDTMFALQDDMIKSHIMGGVISLHR